MDCFKRQLNNIYYMSFKELNNNFQYLGRGSGRAVFGINDNYVIKVSFNRSGDMQCGLENFIYRHAGKKLRKYLCPVVWYKTGMIVMRRALPLTVSIFDRHVDFDRLGRGINTERELRQLAKKYNLLFGDLRSSSSWGFINDEIYLIDYGCTNYNFNKNLIN